MKNLLISLTAFVLALTGLVYKLSLDVGKDKVFGAFDTQLVASTTGRMYSHEAAGTRTATTTVQRLIVEKEVEEVGIILTVQNATNTPGVIFVLPEGAYNTAFDFSTLANLHLSNGAAGAFVTNRSLGNASSTILEFTPNSQGTTSVAYSFKPPVGIRELRFRVWSTGTSSIALDAYKLIK